jgi:hypothetical protein
MATDCDDISMCSTEEMDKYESLHQGEFGHTHVYDVNLLERVGMDEELLSSSGLLVGENSMEGIGQFERQMDDFATVQTEMQASFNSQTIMMYDLFGHFSINPDA